MSITEVLTKKVTFLKRKKILVTQYCIIDYRRKSGRGSGNFFEEPFSVFFQSPILRTTGLLKI